MINNCQESNKEDSQGSSRLLLHQIVRQSDETDIQIKICARVNSTKELPATVQILQSEIPGIFKSKCFNEDSLPFAIEVRDTELGHLFEHILLEFLFQMKKSRGDTRHINGYTDWDFDAWGEGVYRINLSLGKSDAPLIEKALERASLLFEKIYRKSLINTGESTTPLGGFLPA